MEQRAVRDRDSRYAIVCWRKHAVLWVADRRNKQTNKKTIEGWTFIKTHYLADRHMQPVRPMVSGHKSSRFGPQLTPHQLQAFWSLRRWRCSCTIQIFDAVTPCRLQSFDGRSAFICRVQQSQCFDGRSAVICRVQQSQCFDGLQCRHLQGTAVPVSDSYLPNTTVSHPKRQES